jgi:hypothetical protein
MVLCRPIGRGLHVQREYTLLYHQWESSEMQKTIGRYAGIDRGD